MKKKTRGAKATTETHVDDAVEQELLDNELDDEDDVVDDETDVLDDVDEEDADDLDAPAVEELTEDEGVLARAANPVQEPPETIGMLVFVPNSDYPYPFKVATPPRFWMEETTGILNDAVETYMNGEKLSPAQLTAIKVYLRQYVERAMLAGPANKPKLLQKLDKLKNRIELEHFADEVAEFGAEFF